mmetsp:Transcript_60793/g.130642  ORF Transcript_60793/g.130642 Transcript_60793/m.130642 type:complete len:340 (+) Transcript_60793:168-1187(+)
MRTAQDQLRQHRARQSVLTERDKLLKGADKRIELEKFLPSDGKDTARAVLITLGLATVGGIPYMVMVLMWFFNYHKSFPNTLAALVVLIVLSIGMCLASTKRAMGRERQWLWWQGVLCGQATIIGCILGFFLYFRHLAYYWKYEELRTYTNVAAAQDAVAFGDGSMFLFTEDTHLDPMRAVGYQGRFTGNTFCVAPVVDSSMTNVQDIYYWAIGENCCSPRAEFHCDDAEDVQTRSALVVLEPEDVVRPFMRWAVKGATYPKYVEAIKLQEATYFTKAAIRPKLVYWSRDPIALKDSFYWAAANICGWFSGFYVFFLYVGTFFIARTLVPKQRKEGVVR